MRFLVTGKSGQVASAMLEAGPARGADIVTVGRPEFDLSVPNVGLQALWDLRPDMLVSAAAYTFVDKAESERQAAEQCNAQGPAVLARFAKDAGIPIVHLSTDYVFDGSKNGAYVETDQTNPLGTYGETKLGGELAVRSGSTDHVILRTAWVYSSFGSNFVKTMLRLAATHDELRVVDDQRGNPTSAHDLANAIITIGQNLLTHPHASELRGTFHVSGTGSASWADFAQEIMNCSAALGGPHARIVRIPTAEYPTAAKRPANSQLDTTKIRTFHGVQLPDWRRSTEQTVRRLLRAAVRDIDAVQYGATSL